MNKKQLIVLCLSLLSILFSAYVQADNRYSVAGFDDDKAVERFADEINE